MKLNKILFSSILALFACIMPAYATGPALKGMLTTGIPLIGIIILLIKCGIAYLFLKKYIVKTAKLLESIFLVNTLTIIIIIIWLIFSMILVQGNSYRNIGIAFLIIGITLIPLISDYGLIKWQLKRLETEKLIITKTSNSRLVLMIISMYLASAFLILILFRDLIF